MNDNVQFVRGLVIFCVALCLGIGAVFGVGMLMSKIKGVSDEKIVFEDNDGIRDEKTENEESDRSDDNGAVAEKTTKKVVTKGGYAAFDDSLWVNSVQYDVGKGKTYATISDAVSAWESAGYPVATVNIANGEYYEYIRPYSGKTIAFIGESRDGVILKSTGGTYGDTPVIVANSNVQIRNMTIIADHSANADFSYEGAAYPHSRASAIHIDGGDNEYRKGVVYIENVKAVSYQSAAIVANLIPDSTVRIENCECISYTEKEVGGETVPMLKYGAITCTRSEPWQYASRSTERLELINVEATAENTAGVIYLKNGIPGEEFDLFAYDTKLVSPAVKGKKGNVVYDKGEGGALKLDALSKKNNCEMLNFKEQ